MKRLSRIGAQAQSNPTRRRPVRRIRAFEPRYERCCFFFVTRVTPLPPQDESVSQGSNPSRPVPSPLVHTSYLLPLSRLGLNQIGLALSKAVNSHLIEFVLLHTSSCFSNGNHTFVKKKKGAYASGDIRTAVLSTYSTLFELYKLDSEALRRRIHFCVFIGCVRRPLWKHCERDSNKM